MGGSARRDGGARAEVGGGGRGGKGWRLKAAGVYFFRSRGRVNQRERVSGILVAVSYWILALCAWLPHGPRTGLPYETAFPWNSEVADFPWTMLYYGDPLRVFTSVFYDLGYRFSSVLGIPGSYLGLEIVFVVLLWARGWLLYLTVRSLLPGARWLAFVAGAVALTHGSDEAAMFAGQLNQLGYMFWLLLAFYCLTRATEESGSRWRGVFGAGALASCYLSLYSYESPLFLVLIAPVFLAAADWGRVRRHVVLMLLWYSTPLALGWRYVRRMYVVGQATYQSSVMRHDFDLSALLSEWAAQVRHSLVAWEWRPGGGDEALAVYGYVAAGVFAAACFALYRLEGSGPAGEQRVAWRAMGWGVVACAMSFPAYLFLAGGGGFWRTQFLSSLGAGVAMGALLVAVAGRLGKAQVVVVALAGALTVQMGVEALVASGQRHWEVWERHRRVFAQMLAEAPRLKAGTIVVLRGVPKEPDPFGDALWFDFGVRLAYPRQEVAGVYFLAGGSAGPNQSLKLTAGGEQGEIERWKWNGAGMPPLIREGAAKQAVFFEMDEGGRVRLVRSWPKWLPVSDIVKQGYEVSAVVEGGAAPAIAANRYGPLGGGR